MDKDQFQEMGQLQKLWGEFLKTKDDVAFFAYLRLFVDCYQRSLHRGDSRDDDSLKLSNLPENLLSKISSHLMYYNHKETKVSMMTERQKKNIIMVIQSLSTLSRNAHNVALIASLSVVTSIYHILDIPSLQTGDHVLKQIVMEYILLLEKLFDPYSTWYSRFHNSVSCEENATNKEYPAAVDGVTITFICECFDVPHLDYELRSKLIDLIGCVISGSERNAMLIITEAILDKLCNALTDNNLEVLTVPTGLRRNIFSCFTLMVQTLHCAYPGMRQMEVHDIINRYLSTIELVHASSTSANPDFFTPLFDTLRLMISNQRDSEGLKASFNSANVFERVVGFVSKFQESASSSDLLNFHKAFISCLSSFLYRSKVSKTAFKQSVGYNKLLDVLKTVPPDKALLLQLVDMAVERPDTSTAGNAEYNKMENAAVVSLLVSWLPHIPSVTEHVWLARKIFELATVSDKNRITCCDNGIIYSALKSVELCAQHKQFTKVTGILMCLVEKLGALSITAVEIKLLVSLLQIETCYAQGSFTKRILRAFSYMMEEQRIGRALSYFSLPIESSVIRVPDDLKPDSLKKGGGGFSFHTWLCAEPSQQPSTRRVIYSFQAGNGGFESFLSHEGYLHVAMTTEDKNFHVVDVPEMVLADEHWHMLDVVHAVSSSSIWKVSVYIDGTLIKKSSMAAVNLKNKLSYSVGGPITDSAAPPVRDSCNNPSDKSIGSFLGGIKDRMFGKRKKSTEEAPVMKTVEAEYQHEVFGKPIGLCGDLVTICLFKCCLTADQVSQMYKKGANHTEVFFSSSLRSEVVFQYHPKMCSGQRCVDMSAYTRSMDGTLVNGHTCLSHSITDMIKCIGGFQVIIPLLEQVQREPQRDADQDLFEEDAGNDNTVSTFFQLLGSFIVNSEEHEDHLLSTNSIPTISALVQKVDSSLIDEYTLMAVQNLLHDSVRPGSLLYNSVMQHILFDFRLWNNSDKWEVRVVHAQYLYNIITQSGSDMFRKSFGVQFILDSISMFYCKRSSMIESDIRTVRSALFNIIKFYVKKNISKEELLALLMFIHTVQDDTVVLEAIAMLRSLIDMPGDQIHLKLYENDGAVMLYHMLVNPDPYLFSFTGENRRKRVPLAIKQAILKLILALLGTNKVLDTTKKTLYLVEYGMGGLVSLLQPLKPPSDKLSLQLMEIVCHQTPDPNYRNMLCVVSLARYAALPTKLSLGRMVQQVIKDKPTCVSDIIQCVGWQESISCLIKNDVRAARGSTYSSQYSGDPEPFVVVSLNETDDERSEVEVSLTSSTSDSEFLPSQPESLHADDSINSAVSHEERSSDCGILTQLQAISLDMHCKLLWDGLRGSSQEIWKERMKVFHSINSAKGTILVPAVKYTRLLIEYLLTECCAIVKDHTPAEADSTENGQQLIHLVSDFLNSHCKEEESCSEDLLNLTLDLLAKMTVWHPVTGWSELARVGLNILLHFVGSSNSEICATACSKLNHLIQTDEFKLESEIYYIINSVHDALSSTGNRENDVHILQVMKAVLEKHSEMLGLVEHLPHLTSSDLKTGAQVRLDEGVEHYGNEHWKKYLHTVVKEKRSHCLRLFKQVEQEMLNLWNEVENEQNSDWHKFQRENGESQLLFKSNITTPLNAAIDSELKRFSIKTNSFNQNIRVILDQWKSRMRFFSSERGTWAKSGESGPIHWKMSSHENHCRMRIKMIPNDHYEDHRDASLARDTNDPAPLRNDPPSIANLATPSQGANADDDDGMFGPNSTDESLDEGNSSPEELLLKVDCELISMMDSFPGRLEITNRCIYFFEHIPSNDDIGELSTSTESADYIISCFVFYE